MNWRRAASGVVFFSSARQTAAWACLVGRQRAQKRSRPSRNSEFETQSPFRFSLCTTSYDFSTSLIEKKTSLKLAILAVELAASEASPRRRAAHQRPPLTPPWPLEHLPDPRGPRRRRRALWKRLCRACARSKGRVAGSNRVGRARGGQGGMRPEGGGRVWGRVGGWSSEVGWGAQGACAAGKQRTWRRPRRSCHTERTEESRVPSGRAVERPA